MNHPRNPVTAFEIPVRDLDQAVAFYEHVFGITLERAEVDGNQMAHFPYVKGAPGASGSLACGDSYEPSEKGTRVYLHVQDIAATLARAVAAGGAELYPVTDVGALGQVAEFRDCEGNRIALNQPAAEA